MGYFLLSLSFILFGIVDIVLTSRSGVRTETFKGHFLNLLDHLVSFLLETLDSLDLLYQPLLKECNLFSQLQILLFHYLVVLLHKHDLVLETGSLSVIGIMLFLLLIIINGSVLSWFFQNAV